MSHRIASCKITSATPYSQSNFFQTPKPQKMNHDEYEKTYWREKMHVDSDGNVFIPPMSIKRATDEACKRLALQVPGKGKTQYTKFLVAGALIVDPITLLDAKGKPIKAADVQGDWVHCDAKGMKGGKGGTTVKRCFPVIQQWTAKFDYQVFDDAIPKEVLEKCLHSAGMFVGIGRFRPENGGYYGRFTTDRITWKELA